RRARTISSWAKLGIGRAWHAARQIRGLTAIPSHRKRGILPRISVPFGSLTPGFISRLCARWLASVVRFARDKAKPRRVRHGGKVLRIVRRCADRSRVRHLNVRALGVRLPMSRAPPMAPQAQRRSRLLIPRAKAMFRALGQLPAWAELGIYCV